MEKKMNSAIFASRRGISRSFWSRVLSGKRNMNHDLSVKIARSLGTRAEVWKRDGFSMARVAAWSDYLDKRNGGDK